MKKKIIIMTVCILIVTLCVIVFIWFGVKPLLAMLGVGGVAGGIITGNKKVSVKEVKRAVKKTEKTNDKIRNGDTNSIRDAFNSIGGTANKRD